MANFWCDSPVPREPVALNDYRWNLLMQGIGPENLVVHKCRNLSQTIPLEPGQRKKKSSTTTFAESSKFAYQISIRKTRALDRNR